ncbi:DUF6221 family protein [Streptomyces griseoviridis]|uniref:DUF6221 family protein n=1 Tax=Streptomyces griseoviridis TaxID=45398 RepID=UPI00344CB876
MDEMVPWLRAQLEEDERTARAILWEGSGNKLAWGLLASATVEVGRDDFYAGDRTIANHIVEHDPDRVLREIDADRELLTEYERVLTALAAHHAEVARLNKQDDTDPFQRAALRREADYLPAMLHVLERWAKRKAAVYQHRPGYLEAWRP